MEAAEGHLDPEGVVMTATMNAECCRSKKPHLRNVGITRVVLVGVALSALATFTWYRMDVRPQLWPKILDALHVDTGDPVVEPPHGREQQGKPLQGADHMGMVDVDCLGRVQQYKYRKKDHHFPLSPALTGALAEYTRMHARCCTWKMITLADQAHGEEVAAAGARGCQYVVYHEGYEGLGNRLLSLVAAFAYALVTNRALVIDATRGHLAQLLCEPFPRAQTKHGDLAWNNFTRGTATWLLPSQVARGVGHQAVTLEVAMSAQFANLTAVHVSLRHEQSVGDQQFFGAEAQRRLRKVPWVVWESNQYYVPRLFMLREMWAPKLRAWFPDVSLVFTQLGRVLCVPRNAVWHRIRQVHEGEMAWGLATAQVGIQVRRHSVSDNASFSEAVYRRIVECVVDAGMVPPPTTTTQKGTVVLVTSLQSMYYEKMRERWSRSRRRRPEQVKFVMVSQEGTEQYSAEQARKAMVEIWLLSLCSDGLATSSWSTFGYVAQALAGMRPRILNIRGAHPDAEDPALPACHRGQSPEPCLHYPFTASAAAAAGATRNASDVQLEQQEHEHALWVARHIRACQDETRGVQLVA